MLKYLFLALVLTLTAAPAPAAQSQAVATAHSTVTLVSESDTHGTEAVRVGLHFALAPGWHIYWRNSGDAGQPPELDTAIVGGTAGPILWPTPRRLPEGPLMTFGYLDEVMLPFVVTPRGDGPLAVTVKASWLICEHVCVPESGVFELALPAGDGAAGAEAGLFRVADQHTPLPSPFTATLSPDGVLGLAGAGLGPRAARGAWFFAGTTDAVKAASPQKLAVADGRLTLALDRGVAFDPKGIEGVLLLTDASGADTALAIDAAPGPVSPIATTGGIGDTLELLVGAFLGGLILNLMPCVFPVLALKAVAIARLSGSEGAAVRRHALVYSAGIVLAFVALGGLFMGLRAAGSAVGWGFQFQSPGFVVGTGWLVFLVGLNLSGVFEVTIQPGATLAARLPRHALWGDLATGALAVLLATPCTAPFMGAAIAAALAGPAIGAAVIFVALGLGLAAPALLLAVVPSAARHLPRPGRWMELLRQALAFPMYGAAAWLAWVTERQSGGDGVLTIGIGFVLLGLAAWTYGLAQRAEGGWRRVGQGVSFASVAATAALLVALATTAAPDAGRQATVQADGIEQFSTDHLASLRAAGTPVFVDLTAAWCVTCLVNERVALDTASVRAAFARHHVVYMKGDWTRADPAITAFLRAHDRDGVPLYLLYPAGGGEPLALPQILTPSLVLDAVENTKS